MKRLLFVSAGLFVAACNNSAGLAVTDEPAGANCPSGGVKIESGGTTRYVCNGASGDNGSNGAASLVKQTPLAIGDAQCPAGGVRVDTGLDDGGDGGVPNDGALQPAEVSSTTFVCANDSSAKVGSMQVPPGAAGTAIVDVSGGRGDAGVGGQGGLIELHINRGTNGGHLKTFKTGHVDATFTAPAALPGDFGAVPANVTSDTTVVEYATTAPGASVDAGTLFISGSRLYLASGTAAPGTMATGLSVAAGVTLTLPSRPSNVYTPVELARSCRNAGTLALASAPGTAGHFALQCGDFEGLAGSRVDASGQSGDAGDAGIAGSAFTITASGTLRNRGALVATGGAGNPAGLGGTISLSSTTSTLFNAGPISVGGGAGLGTAQGGAGGWIALNAGLELLNSGALDASGSAGRSGGSGGQVQLSATSFVGGLRNTGALTANGAPGAPGCPLGPPCAGGGGGQVRLTTAQGALVNDATLSAKGGSSSGGSGGPGGLVYLEEEAHHSTRFGDSLVPCQSVLVSGSIDVSGGAGASGGAGGTVSVLLAWNTVANGAELQLLGYAAFLARGGDGSQGGGGGGSIDVAQWPGELVDYWAEFGGTPLPAGATLNTVDLSASGGSCPLGQADLSGGPGGPGGQVRLRTQRDSFFSNAPWELLVNAGAIDASGGAGDTAGSGGNISLYGRTGASSTGALTVNGGAGDASGGAGGSVVVASDDGAVSNSGATQLKGGAASGFGVAGAGGSFGLQGVQSTLASTVDASGGASDTTRGTGGRGGTIDCSALAGPTTVSVAAPAGLSVAGGAAATRGAPGFVVIDGVQVTSAWTH